MKTVIIPEGDQESRQHKENGYPYVEFAEKTPDDVREITVKNIREMRDEYQVSCQRAHPC